MLSLTKVFRGPSFHPPNQVLYASVFRGPFFSDVVFGKMQKNAIVAFGAKNAQGRRFLVSVKTRFYMPRFSGALFSDVVFGKKCKNIFNFFLLRRRPKCAILLMLKPGCICRAFPVPIFLTRLHRHKLRGGVNNFEPQTQIKRWWLRGGVNNFAWHRTQIVVVNNFADC